MGARAKGAATVTSPDEHPQFPPVSELVPHAAPMILVDRLVAWSAERAHVQALVRAGGPFVVEGRVPGTILLEYMAQAIAVANGWRQRIHHLAPGAGLLLGTRELELAVDDVGVGDHLDIHIEREFDDGKLARYACRVEAGGHRIAEATINVIATTPEET